MFYEYRVLSLCATLRLVCLLWVLNTQPELLEQVISWCLLPHAPQTAATHSCLVNPARVLASLHHFRYHREGHLLLYNCVWVRFFVWRKSGRGIPSLIFPWMPLLIAAHLVLLILLRVLPLVRLLWNSAWMIMAKSANLGRKHYLPPTVVGDCSN